MFLSNSLRHEQQASEHRDEKLMLEVARAITYIPKESVERVQDEILEEIDVISANGMESRNLTMEKQILGDNEPWDQPSHHLTI